jgi:hypothetical protein
MFYHIIKPSDDKDISEDDKDDDNMEVPKDIANLMIEHKTDGATGGNGGTTAKKSGVLRNKIKFVSKLLKMQKLLRY